MPGLFSQCFATELQQPANHNPYTVAVDYFALATSKYYINILWWKFLWVYVTTKISTGIFRVVKVFRGLAYMSTSFTCFWLSTIPNRPPPQAFYHLQAPSTHHLLYCQ